MKGCITPLASIVLATVLAAASPAGLAASSQGPTVPVNLSTSARRVRPLWRDRLDLRFEGFGRVGVSLVAAEGRVFYLRNGRLVAAELATGRRIWSYGKGLGGLFAYGDGRVYVVVGDRQVVALSGRTGRRLWVSAKIMTRIDRLLLHQDLLLANGYYDGVAALDAASGTVRWRDREYESLGPAAVVGDVVLWQVSQGEPHFTHILAYDLRMGRRRWEARHASGPLAVQGEWLYLFDEWTRMQLDNPDNVQIRVINWRTGKELERWIYRADFNCTGVIGPESEEVVLHGAFVYIVDRCGERVSRFLRGGARNPLLRYSTFDHGRWVAGPYRGMLFFVTAGRHLLGVRVEGGRPKTVNRVKMPTGSPRYYEAADSAISRVDLIGNDVYVGQTDGWFHALDFQSGRRLFSVRSAGRRFGPTLRVGDYLIVQAEGEVLVVRAPR